MTTIIVNEPALVGDKPLITAKFTLNRILTAPTSVTVSVKDPSSNVDEPTPANPATGVYTTSVLFDEAGDWVIGFYATGTVAKSFLVQFRVDESALS